MVVDVGHPQRLDRRGPNPQQHLGPDEQQVHHVGVGPVAAELLLKPVVPGGVGADVAAQRAPTPRVTRLVLVLVGQELGEGRKQRAQRHDDAPAADEAGPMGARAKVADEQDEYQVADLKATGDHAHVSTLQVEPTLKRGKHTHLGDNKYKTII